MRVTPILTAIAILTFSLAKEAAAGPALLFDPEDGKVLYAEDPDSQWHPASLTKIMTAYLTFEALKSGRVALDTMIPVSVNATRVQPSKLGLPVGVEITVDVALQALIIKSANDVAIMLAETIAGSDVQFVALMNATARRLGMTRTTFVNPNGLPTPEQMTTARDLAKLARAVVRDFPEYNHYWAMKEARIGKTLLTSHNGLLKTFEGADGLKTGFICDSGFNVVASATRDGKRLIAVVLGEINAKDRTMRAASLLEHGFQQLGWKQMFNPTTIDNMAPPAETKGIMSMRQTVTTWDCGTAKPKAKLAKKKTRPKVAKAVGEKAGQVATPAGSGAEAPTPSKTTPETKPAKQKTSAPSAAPKPEVAEPATPTPAGAGADSAAP
jgi:D-alanyl-D-alanine carboxypeptidase